MPTAAADTQRDLTRSEGVSTMYDARVEGVHWQMPRNKSGSEPRLLIEARIRGQGPRDAVGIGRALGVLGMRGVESFS